jgi:hypothetical protein
MYSSGLKYFYFRKIKDRVLVEHRFMDELIVL